MPKPLTLRDAAKELGIERRTLARWIKTRGCPYQQPGGRKGKYRIDCDAVREWMRRDVQEQARRRPAPEGPGRAVAAMGKKTERLAERKAQHKWRKANAGRGIGRTP